MATSDGAGRRASDVIIEEVTSWPGVEIGEGNFGSVLFRVGRRELGHLHGDTLADLPFTRALRDELIARGEKSPPPPAPRLRLGLPPHPHRRRRRRVIRLLRMQYERATGA